MKIRTDFVTNSSSSSYIGIFVSSPTIDKIFKSEGLDYTAADIMDLTYGNNDENHTMNDLMSKDCSWDDPVEVLINVMGNRACCINDLNEVLSRYDPNSDGIDEITPDCLVKMCMIINDHAEKINKDLEFSAFAYAIQEAGENLEFSHYSSKDGHGQYHYIDLNEVDQSKIKCYGYNFCSDEGLEEMKKYGTYIEF